MQLFFILSSIGFVSTALAESAPVYDADSMQQQFEAPPETNQPDVLPPPPQQQGAVQDNSNPDATFVPMQEEGGSEVTQAKPAPSLPVPIEQRVNRVEQQINNLQTSDVSAKMESLQNQVQSLRGQIDALTHVLDKVQNQQKTLSSDLDKRLAQTASSGKLMRTASASDAKSAPITSKVFKAAPKLAANDTQTVTTTTTASPQPNVAEEQEIYQTAYNLIKIKKYNEAINVLQNMLQKYPSGQFASNAHYWLGELYGLLGKNDQALHEFDTVVGNYPESPRVSDAQFKIGLIYAAQSKWPEAKNVFKKIINRYPGTTSSRLASEQLKQIKQAGH